MAETEHHHHHSSSGHHHHHQDGASKFKRESLRAIERRKFLEKWGIRVLSIIAALMAIAVVAVYMFG